MMEGRINKIRILRSQSDMPERVSELPKKYPCIMVDRRLKGSMDGEMDSYTYIYPPDKLSRMSVLEAWAEGYKQGGSR